MENGYDEAGLIYCRAKMATITEARCAQTLNVEAPPEACAFCDRGPTGKAAVNSSAPAAARPMPGDEERKAARRRAMAERMAAARARAVEPDEEEEKEDEAMSDETCAKCGEKLKARKFGPDKDMCYSCGHPQGARYYTKARTVRSTPPGALVVPAPRAISRTDRVPAPRPEPQGDGNGRDTRGLLELADKMIDRMEESIPAQVLVNISEAALNHSKAALLHAERLAG